MGQVIAMQNNQESDTNDDSELTQRFQRWWQKQDKHTKDAIREIINSDLPKATKEQAKEVLDFLNLKTGRNYRPVETNLKMIKARLDSGVTVQDCKAVIAIKCREWAHDEKMEKYLRPLTLFCASKFEQYLGEIGHDEA